MSVEEFEAASAAASAGRKDALDWLTAFRQHPAAFDTARSVLQRSSHDTAQFQAITVIRDVFVSSWEVLPPEARDLRTQLLQFLLASQGCVGWLRATTDRVGGNVGHQL
jgi:hypothetical protein